MNRITLLLILVVTFSCKDEKKVKTIKELQVVEKQFKVGKQFSDTDFLTISKVKVDLAATEEFENGNQVYNVVRATTTEPAYLASQLIPVIYASEYRVSVFAKKGSKGSRLGLRIQGNYPDRVDAIFDLEQGIIVDYKISQDFEKPLATIEKLSGDWYKCAISAEVAADNVRIILGATSIEKDIWEWEGNTKTLCDVNIIPSSLLIEERLYL
ncbi:MAG: hypothetical protein ABJM36_07040 [Algibacter sp.]|uniref:phage head spike fiber domain-containing protein n=1 Tax=Algibacter sp. TaxID=1872428 RepID=UPI003297AEEF